jgi:hypothetical protein
MLNTYYKTSLYEKIVTMSYNFRKATPSEIPQIWDILQKAIARRKEDGSNQWQDGYQIQTGYKTTLTKMQICFN